MSEKRVFIKGALFSCPHWHRMICPLRYYHKANTYTAMIDLNIQRLKGKYDWCFVHGMIQPEELADLYALVDGGCRIVWCADDDYFSLPEGHHVVLNRRTAASLAAIGSMASACIFTTHHLQGVYEDRLRLKCPTFVCPNLLEPSHYKIDWEQRLKRKKPLVAWFGCPGHDEDLALLVPVFEELAKAKEMMDVTFFGSCHPVIRAKWGGSWVREHGGLEFPAYPDAMYGLSPDIALCPLNDDGFARGRSDLKLKESMAMGAYTLFSPVGPFENFPFGMICRTTDDWVRAVLSFCKVFYSKPEEFFGLARSVELQARQNFFWGSNSPAQQSWNDSLDRIFEE